MVEFAANATQLLHQGEVSGSFVCYGVSLTNIGASAIIVQVTNSAGTVFINGFLLPARTTIPIPVPFIVNAGLKFTVTSGATADGRFTLFHSNRGA